MGFGLRSVTSGRVTEADDQTDGSLLFCRAARCPDLLSVDGRGPQPCGGGAGASAERLRPRLRGRRLPASAPLEARDLAAVTYEFQLRRCPWTYEAGYRLLGVAGSALWRFNVLLCGALTNRSVRRVLAQSNPDVVVSTYPFASLVLGQMRRTGNLQVPVATYLTDFAVHPLWVHAGVDLHLAVSEDSARAAERRGALTAVGTGPLVGEHFRGPQRSRTETRHSLGIAEEDRVALVVAGSLGFGAVQTMVRGITDCGDYHVIAVCGTNAKLETTLLQGGRCGTIVGWTDEMPDLMGASDVLVENAGGLTAMEAFAAGLPVVTYQPDRRARARQRPHDEPRPGQPVRPNPAELALALDEVTKPGASREALVAAGSALFADDPARRILDLADAGCPTSQRRRRRRVHAALAAAWRAPARLPMPARVAAFALVALVGTYGALTEGAETVAALGVGVITPPAGTHATTYLGVRLTPTELRDPAVLRGIRDVHATAVVDGRSRAHLGTELQRLARMGIDIANGGWGGTHSMLPWTRAKQDCQRAGRAIALRARVKPDEFVPGRELNAFDQIMCRTGGSGPARLVLPNHTFSATDLPEHLHSSRIYLLDGRRSDGATLVTALERIQSRVTAAGLHVRSLRYLK